MCIAVMGAGGVGGYFGAKLAQAGHDVAFVARGRHLAAMREAWAVGRAQGVALADDLVAQLMQFTDGLPAEMKSSMPNDLVAGNRLEAPWLCGDVTRIAAAAGVPAPVNATLYAALKPYCGGMAR